MNDWVPKATIIRGDLVIIVLLLFCCCCWCARCLIVTLYTPQIQTRSTSIRHKRVGDLWATLNFKFDIYSNKSMQISFATEANYIHNWIDQARGNTCDANFYTAIRNWIVADMYIFHSMSVAAAIVYFSAVCSPLSFIGFHSLVFEIGSFDFCPHIPTVREWWRQCN